jgi:hypothetical protein
MRRATVAPPRARANELSTAATSSSNVKRAARHLENTVAELSVDEVNVSTNSEMGRFAALLRLS